MKEIAAKILLVLFGVLFINSSASSHRVNAENNQTGVIAHRGIIKRAPENTIDSIMDAAQDKADYAELDVQESKDGVVVLMHDNSLKRVTGVNKKVSEMDYSQLNRLYVRKKYQKSSFNEKIPTLEMVVKRAKGRIRLDIEIKPYGRERDLTEKVVGLIEKNNMVKQCIVTSFDYDVLVYVKQLNPKIMTSFLLKSPVKDVSIKDVDIFSVEKHYVTAQLVKNIHRSNKRIHVWTVNNIKDMRRFKDFGVDYIITDNIDGFRTINNDEQIKNYIFSNMGKIVQFS